MNIRLRYFARLHEAFGIAEEAFSLGPGPCTLEALLGQLRQRGGVWAEELAAGRSYRLAVNHDLAEPGQALAEDDEVAIFPPVTGG